MNRKWDRGSPCLIPRVGLKLPNRDPSKRIEKEEVVIHWPIQLIQVGWKPNKSMILRRNDYSIESKAFFISNFKAIKPPLPLLYFIVWKSSWAMIELSWMDLPLRKAVCMGKQFYATEA
jgi:hypothetical protein